MKIREPAASVACYPYRSNDSVSFSLSLPGTKTTFLMHAKRRTYRWASGKEMPVEAVSDLESGPRVQATSSEAGKPTRESGKPLA